MSFNDWLREQTHRQDEVGDLARDVEIDDEFPNEVSCGNEYLEYLLKIGAGEGPVEALKIAYQEYCGEKLSSDEDEDDEDDFEDEDEDDFYDDDLDDELEDDEEDEDFDDD